MTEFVDYLEKEDLEHITSSLHKISPQTRGYMLSGIEKARIGDNNMAFHMERMGKEIGEDVKTVLISFEFIMRYFGSTLDFSEKTEEIEEIEEDD